jgi:deoxyribodipyrimidine photo-lyase
MVANVPDLRIRVVNQQDVRAEGDYVLYWMVASRRTTWNFSLQRAVEWARDLKKPLVVFEALRCGYRWASDRLHRFVIQGMHDNQRALDNKPVTYYPYLEPEQGAAKGLLAEWAKSACVVVSDDYPCFFLPAMVRVAARQIPVRFELIDSNGMLPMRAADRVYLRAYDFRRFLQKNLIPHLDEAPAADPLKGIQLPQLSPLPKSITGKWPPADADLLADCRPCLKDFPIDHEVGVAPTDGGPQAAERRLRAFLTDKLTRYDEQRNQPQVDATSGLSPYLHFGHVGVHQVFQETMATEDWSPAQVAEKAKGSSSGWWGTSADVEGFMDELITWRELGFNMCWQQCNYDKYESLPEWARNTLADHADDPREYVYSLDEFAASQTHDPLWNAAQRQLVSEGRIHNYLRMLWGKKILEWSPSPPEALAVMIELNNRFALDGRDPNSYSGIFWVLGRYDRPWAPERPVFGKIRFMSSQNTARKVRVKDYIQKYAST